MYTPEIEFILIILIYNDRNLNLASDSLNRSMCNGSTSSKKSTCHAQGLLKLTPVLPTVPLH